MATGLAPDLYDSIVFTQQKALAPTNPPAIPDTIDQSAVRPVVFHGNGWNFYTSILATLAIKQNAYYNDQGQSFIESIPKATGEPATREMWSRAGQRLAEAAVTRLNADVNSRKAAADETILRTLGQQDAEAFKTGLFTPRNPAVLEEGPMSPAAPAILGEIIALILNTSISIFAPTSAGGPYKKIDTYGPPTSAAQVILLKRGESYLGLLPMTEILARISSSPIIQQAVTLAGPDAVAGAPLPAAAAGAAAGPIGSAMLAAISGRPRNAFRKKDTPRFKRLGQVSFKDLFKTGPKLNLVINVAGEEVILDEKAIDPERFQHYSRVSFSKGYFPGESETRVAVARKAFETMFGRGSQFDSENPMPPCDADTRAFVLEGIHNRIRTLGDEILTIHRDKEGIASLDKTGRMGVLERLKQLEAQLLFQDERDVCQDYSDIQKRSVMTELSQEQEEEVRDLLRKFTMLFLQRNTMVPEYKRFSDDAEDILKRMEDMSFTRGDMDDFLAQWRQTSGKTLPPVVAEILEGTNTQEGVIDATVQDILGQIFAEQSTALQARIGTLKDEAMTKRYADFLGGLRGDMSAREKIRALYAWIWEEVVGALQRKRDLEQRVQEQQGDLERLRGEISVKDVAVKEAADELDRERKAAAEDVEKADRAKTAELEAERERITTGITAEKDAQIRVLEEQLRELTEALEALRGQLTTALAAGTGAGAAAAAAVAEVQKAQGDTESARANAAAARTQKRAVLEQIRALSGQAGRGAELERGAEWEGNVDGADGTFDGLIEVMRRLKAVVPGPGVAADGGQQLCFLAYFLAFLMKSLFLKRSLFAARMAVLDYLAPIVQRLVDAEPNIYALLSTLFKLLYAAENPDAGLPDVKQDDVRVLEVQFEGRKSDATAARHHDSMAAIVEDFFKGIDQVVPVTTPRTELDYPTLLCLFVLLGQKYMQQQERELGANRCALPEALRADSAAAGPAVAAAPPAPPPVQALPRFQPPPFAVQEDDNEPDEENDSFGPGAVLVAKKLASGLVQARPGKDQFNTTNKLREDFSAIKRAFETDTSIDFEIYAKRLATFYKRLQYHYTTGGTAVKRSASQLVNDFNTFLSTAKGLKGRDTITQKPIPISRMYYGTPDGDVPIINETPRDIFGPRIREYTFDDLFISRSGKSKYYDIIADKSPVDLNIPIK